MNQKSMPNCCRRKRWILGMKPSRSPRKNHQFIVRPLESVRPIPRARRHSTAIPLDIAAHIHSTEPTAISLFSGICAKIQPISRSRSFKNMGIVMSRRPINLPHMHSMVGPNDPIFRPSSQNCSNFLLLRICSHSIPLRNHMRRSLPPTTP